jgi:ParB-like chromosome segregation protein Spo0J|nr:MAG TPA: ParB protein [Caudoviricetes sp.]
MKQKQLTVTYKRTEDLIPYVNNARTHSDEQVTQIASSIKEFGFNNPILTDGENGVIAGHGRLLAAKKLGLETVPTIELSGLTKAQKKAYILADNKIALNSGWDIDLLSVELQELQDTDLAPVTGFSAEELNTLLSETTEPAEEEEPEEEEPEEDSFNLTLSIPIEYKEQVQDFVKSFGPEDLIQKIIDMTS